MSKNVNCTEIRHRVLEVWFDMDTADFSCRD